MPGKGKAFDLAQAAKADFRAGIPTTLVSVPQNHYNRGKRQSRKGDISWEKQKSAAFSAF